MDDRDFERLLHLCVEIAETFPEGVIFIGGIAVYLHTINLQGMAEYAEFTHDADFYISLADMADLRDLEEVTANRRLSKHQLIKGGFEFDIYTERHSALIVPYDQVAAHAVPYDSVKVANLTHLLALKLEAFRDRKGSTKGQKDAKDIIRIVLVGARLPQHFSANNLIGFISQEHTELLLEVARGAEFLSLAKGNAKTAKNLRTTFRKVADEVIDQYGQRD